MRTLRLVHVGRLRIPPVSHEFGILTFGTCLRDLVIRCSSASTKRLYHFTHSQHNLNYEKIIRNDNRENFVLGEIRSKIIYNSVLHRLEWENRLAGFKKKRKTLNRGESYHCSPVALKYVEDIADSETEEQPEAVFKDEKVDFPYRTYSEFGSSSLHSSRNNSGENGTGKIMVSEFTTEPVPKEQTSEHYIKSWMNDYECYDGDDIEPPWELNYGTPDTNIPVSNTPCGGCGALLHCRDTAIPGYLPSEIFLRLNESNISGTLCQRCHFIRYYNTVLSVTVPPTEYPKLLSEIRNKLALVVLMVDLTDFPCSIWPQILDIIGRKRPVVVVGNKIDLLPQDCSGFLDHVKKCIIKSLDQTGLSAANIKHVELISARTGYGIEELITRLQNMWHYKGDVYLVGCTNVGKSSLFNALLQSDFCKVKAVDLIERATTSPWPGTTMNLLKFPILRPSGWRLYMRTKRLLAERERKQAEDKLRHFQLKRMNDVQYATLVGHIGRTFQNEEQPEVNDPFSVSKSLTIQQSGINPKDPEFSESRWCFDTPGTVQPDQILNLLTTEELILTLPKKMLIPRSFCLKPQRTLFIAGLGRLDYVDGNESVRFTVFASDCLPVTICQTDIADTVYSSLLGSSLFVVPCGGDKRLSQWPQLATTPKSISVVGISSKESCADIVLSSAGWIAVTPPKDHVCKLQAWTPDARGIYVRQPALLRYSVNLRGARIRKTPAYRMGRAVYVKN
ncbi:nitric oxide-associated protein 1 [Schistocerca americana]|uniref:nitric oxide-associated protein 1 n=1 Tax=Schistocerca americana TaxID=7009 RepID=UPI001F4F9406|nr:nitric oxide-associated protein 1 [Schistocerca americana]XP_046987581.1 nitric oxide-associated protein 1 [Schistocerca americana]